MVDWLPNKIEMKLHMEARFYSRTYSTAG